MRIQLWSSNFAPEPTGIAPLATVWAKGLQARGHDVTVLAAHAHYPDPVWDRPLRPTREDHDGVDVLRVPLRVGRGTASDRMLQDATFASSCVAAAPLLPAADVVVGATPSFPALGVAALHARVRRTPFVVRIHDILPDGAVATGLMQEGGLVRWLRRYEKACYASAERVVVISRAARRNMLEKGVPDGKVVHIPDSATRELADGPQVHGDADRPVVFTMGNIGLTQNLVAVVRAFQADERLADLGAELVIAGDGVAGDAVRAAITTDRVRVTGILGGADLERETRRATVALISQTSPTVEFNMPSKLMNFMARGLAVVGAVRDDSEVQHVLHEAGAGVTLSPAEIPDRLGPALVHELEDEVLRHRHATGSLAYAGDRFSVDRVLDRWEEVLTDVAPRGARRARRVRRSPEAAAPVQSAPVSGSSARDGRPVVA
ncbi:glycosyltransferase family 4 protein [Patulibacter minatonensis]|uniref:glycosyltransferase family 4 protein n=1 Tax=Patulibacter minatonensis TaxID=298163 RepID=UPI00047C47A7|nr:glycosyltransferase family 4 protein [Patulibacter minatonensis]